MKSFDKTLQAICKHPQRFVSPTTSIYYTIIHIKHFGREELVMLKSTPVKVPPADVAAPVPSLTTTETIEHQAEYGNSGKSTFRLS